MKRSALNSVLISLLFGAVMIPSAQASVVTFFGQDFYANSPVRPASIPNSDAARDSFFNSLMGIATDNLESYAHLSSPSALSVGTVSSSGFSIRELPTGAQGGAFPVSGDKYIAMPGTSLLLDFYTPQQGFGFYANDVADNTGKLTLTLRYVGGATLDIDIPHSFPAPAGKAVSLYYGVIDTSNSLLGITLNKAQTNVDGIALDNFSTGQYKIVPEPSSLVLIALGSLLGFGLRKKLN